MRFEIRIFTNAYNFFLFERNKVTVHDTTVVGQCFFAQGAGAGGGGEGSYISYSSICYS